MRLVTYQAPDGSLRPGALRGEEVFDLDGLAGDAESITGIRAFLEAHEHDLTERTAELSNRLAGAASADAIGSLEEIRLAPPVLDSAKVLCVGLNYVSHVQETGRELPRYPDVFTKFASSLLGYRDDIARTDISENLDFEGEMAVVIGRTCHRVEESEALDHVAGYTVLNDISARDWQFRGTQWTPGKAIDGSTPIGPALVTADEVPDPQRLDVRTTVNGTVMQSSDTSRMIFPVARIVQYISHFLVLRPGDIIATGTPEGIGSKRQPPVWLLPGDEVVIEVSGLGALTNRIV